MRQLAIRLLAFAVVFVLTLYLGNLAWQQLQASRYPDRALAERYLENRLGAMTSEQRLQADIAVKRDPLMAMITAESAGWNGIRRLNVGGPDEILSMQRLALDAGMKAQLDGEAAAKFTNAVFEQYVVLDQVDTTAAEQMLQDLKSLSTDEYGNVAMDASYVLIAPKLSTQHRTTFRRYQDVLSPLLAATDPSDWNQLVAKFEAALPRVGEIARDGQLGLPYAAVYMLNIDFVQAFAKANIPEKDAIDFIGANNSILRETSRGTAEQVEDVSRLQKETGPNGTSLFEYACQDPAIYWLLLHARATADLAANSNAAAEHALTVLKRYSGTDLPRVLMSYAENPDCFRAALDALIRFDNFEAEQQEMRNWAARLLAANHNNAAFKEQLVKHGARLVPAASVTPDALAMISRNSNDIDKFVTLDGRPMVGKPLWTWIPGGSIAFLANELAHGRSTEVEDWIWAGTDALVFVPVGKAGKAGTLIRGSGSVSRSGARVIAASSAMAAKKSVRKAVSLITFGEALVILRTGGIRVAKGALSFAKWSAKNPLKTTMGGMAVLCSLFPDHATVFLDSVPKWCADRMRKWAQEFGTTVVDMPGVAINAMWNRARQLGAEQPLLKPVFYLLAALVTLAVILLPLVLLRKLLPEVFDLLYFLVRTAWIRLTTVLNALGRRPAKEHQ